MTSNLANKLGKLWNTTLDLWLNLQQKYDLWCATNKLIQENNMSNVFARPAKPNAPIVVKFELREVFIVGNKQFLTYEEAAELGKPIKRAIKKVKV